MSRCTPGSNVEKDRVLIMGRMLLTRADAEKATPGGTRSILKCACDHLSPKTGRWEIS